MADEDVVFIDDKGTEWTRENVKDLIEGYKHFKKFQQILDYYKNRF